MYITSFYACLCFALFIIDHSHIQAEASSQINSNAKEVHDIHIQVELLNQTLNLLDQDSEHFALAREITEKYIIKLIPSDFFKPKPRSSKKNQLKELIKLYHFANIDCVCLYKDWYRVISNYKQLVKKTVINQENLTIYEQETVESLETLKDGLMRLKLQIQKENTARQLLPKQDQMSFDSKVVYAKIKILESFTEVLSNAQEAVVKHLIQIASDINQDNDVMIQISVSLSVLNLMIRVELTFLCLEYINSKSSSSHIYSELHGTKIEFSKMKHVVELPGFEKITHGNGYRIWNKLIFKLDDVVAKELDTIVTPYEQLSNIWNAIDKQFICWIILVIIILYR